MRQVVSLVFLLPLLVGVSAQSDSASTCKSARVEPDSLDKQRESTFLDTLRKLTTVCVTLFRTLV